MTTLTHHEVSRQFGGVEYRWPKSGRLAIWHDSRRFPGWAAAADRPGRARHWFSTPELAAEALGVELPTEGGDAT